MMVDWPLVGLGELLVQCFDRHPVEAGRLYPNIGIYGFGRGVFEKPPIDGGTTSATVLYRVKPGQFIYSRLFAFEGAYAIVPDIADGAFVSNEYPIFELNRNLVLPGFLHWFFRRPTVWETLSTLTSGMGDRRRRLPPDRFLSYLIPLPSVPEQYRIVTKLDAIAERIRSVSELRQEIHRDGQALLHSVFHRLIQGAPYRPLAEVAPIVRRPVEIDPESTYPELGVRSFGKGTFHKQPLPGSEVGTKKLYCIHPGDLVFSNVFAWEGAIAIATPQDAGRFGSHRFITCVAHPDTALAEFLCFFLLTREGIEQVREASPGGAGRNRTLGLSKLEQIRVPVPELRRQQEFCVLQSRVSALLESHIGSQPELDALMPAVLDKAFKGQL